MEIRISPLTEEWVDQVCVLEEEAFSMPWHKESFLEMIENPDACYLVALSGEKVLASCGLREIAGEGEITNVVTAKDYRRQGIGRMLLAQILEEGKKRGLSAFTLEVRCSNQAAIDLYKSFGFVEEGVRPGFYEKPREDALIMWKR
ncbi:MAG: ribosomal protein S18-alanine N-acetyltransferase [Lachnospiraceae bacterium]|nr:ribosomal protein S18-alanine N-acetyltransferase [Lachnospiraceae bacterium]